MRSQKGFTIVEMLIVIALMAIMAAFAIPAYQSYMVKNRLNGAARQIMSDLMDARMKASSQNNRFRMIFLDSHRYKILDDDNNNNTEDTGESTQTKDIQTEYYDVTLSATANPIFYPRGTAYGTTVTMTNPSGSKYVKVAITGRVKIDDTP